MGDKKKLSSLFLQERLTAMQQTSPKAMQLNPSEAGWDHGLDIMGSLRQSSHLLPGTDCEQSLFCSKCCQYPPYNSGTVPVLEYKVSILYSCNKVDTGTNKTNLVVLGESLLCTSRQAHDSICRLTGRNGIIMFTVTYCHGYSRCEHNTILYRYPWTAPLISETPNNELKESDMYYGGKLIEGDLRQTANANSYHVTMCFIHLSFTVLPFLISVQNGSTYLAIS